MNNNEQELSSKQLPPSALQSTTEAKEKATISHSNIYQSMAKARHENKIIPSESQFIPMTNFGCAEPKNSLDRSIATSVTKQQQIFSKSHSTPKVDHQHYLGKCNTNYRSNSRRTVVRSNDVLVGSHSTEDILESERLIVCHDKKSKQSQFDSNSLLHKINTSKDRIKELQDSNNLDTILKQLLNSKDLLDSSDSRITFHDTLNPQLLVASNNKHSEKHSFQRNPSTGQFFKCNLTSCESTQKNGSQATHIQSEVSRYTFVHNLLVELSNVGFLFTNGLLAGFSMHVLFKVPITQRELETFVINNSNHCPGVIKFYVICLSLCIAGTAVKRSRLRHSKSSQNKSAHENKGAIIDVILLFINCLALVVTLTNAKIDLYLEEQHTRNMAVAKMVVLDKIETWKKLSIARSTLCMIQWLICCWRMIRIN